jgi:hypothetical protein
MTGRRFWIVDLNPQSDGPRNRRVHFVQPTTLGQARVIADDTIAVMRQQPADLRNDVLRTELAPWLGLASEVERTRSEILCCTTELNQALDVPQRGRSVEL